MNKYKVIATALVLGVCFFTVLLLYVQFLQRRRAKQRTRDVSGTDGNIDQEKRVELCSRTWRGLAYTMTAKAATRSRRLARVPQLTLDFDLRSAAIFDELSCSASGSRYSNYSVIGKSPFSSHKPSKHSISAVQTPDVTTHERIHDAQISPLRRCSFFELFQQIVPRNSVFAERGIRHMSRRGQSQPRTLVPLRDVSENESRRRPHHNNLGNLPAMQTTCSIGTFVLSPEELLALSIYLGSRLAIDSAGHRVSSTPGAFACSIDITSSTDNKWIGSLLIHERDIAHLPAKGSGYSLLYAKYFAAGALPYTHSSRTVHAVFITDDTVKNFEAGRSCTLERTVSRTPQSTFLASLARSKMPILQSTVYDSWSQTNLILDAIAGLPFKGGLPALAAASIIKLVRFAASGGLPPARLLQRLECLVSKVNKHTPGLDVFGPLYEPRNARWVYRLQRCLGNAENPSGLHDTLADKVSRMRRYTTLLQRLMALVSDIKPSDVLILVENATKRETKSAYRNAVEADSFIFPSGTNSRCPDNASSQIEGKHNAPLTLEQQMDEVLKTKLPFNIHTIAFVARMVLVAWTLSVEIVTWEETATEFRILDMKQLIVGNIFMS